MGGLTPVDRKESIVRARDKAAQNGGGKQIERGRGESEGKTGLLCWGWGGGGGVRKEMEKKKKTGERRRGGTE